MVSAPNAATPHSAILGFLGLGFTPPAGAAARRREGADKDTHLVRGGQVARGERHGAAHALDGLCDEAGNAAGRARLNDVRNILRVLRPVVAKRAAVRVGVQHVPDAKALRRTSSLEDIVGVAPCIKVCFVSMVPFLMLLHDASTSFPSALVAWVDVIHSFFRLDSAPAALGDCALQDCSGCVSRGRWAALQMMKGARTLSL